MSELNDYTAAPAAPETLPGAEEKQWGMFAHLSALAGLVIPFGNIIGPLVVWLVKKDTMPFAADQGKEALNFHITVAAFCIVFGIIAIPLMFIGIGFLMIPVIGLVALGAMIISVIGGLKANEGVAYRYPFAIRLIR